MPTMRYDVLHFKRHETDPEYFRSYAICRTDIAMVNVRWPNGTTNQYVAEPRKDGSIEMPAMMRLFLTPEDILQIEENAKLFKLVWEEYPEVAEHIN